MEMDTVLHEVRSWSIEDRMRLIEEVWESLEEMPGEMQLGDSHLADLDRRLEKYRDNPTAGSPWEEVKARLLRDQP